MANSLEGNGGTATQESRQGPQARQPATGPAEFAALQDARRRSAPPVIDGYLAVMLVRYGHWSAEQTSHFLGLEAGGVEQWNHQYREKGLDGLRDLPPPKQAAGAPTPGVLAADNR